MSTAREMDTLKEPTEVNIIANIIANSNTVAVHQDQLALKRSILKSASTGQTLTKSAQAELDRQGKQLLQSLGDARAIARQTDDTKRSVKRLIDEHNVGKKSIAVQCCRFICGCCVNRCCPDRQADYSDQDQILARSKSPLRVNSVDGDESDNGVSIDRLRDLLEARGKRSSKQQPRDDLDSTNWKKTIATPIGAILKMDNQINSEIWYRQVDVSLTQLQQMNQEIGHSLDEQIRLARMLAVYLDYGVDQVMGINETLADSSLPR